METDHSRLIPCDERGLGETAMEVFCQLGIFDSVNSENDSTQLLSS